MRILLHTILGGCERLFVYTCTLVFNELRALDDSGAHLDGLLAPISSAMELDDRAKRHAVQKCTVGEIK